jgi:hypothetical protein
MGWFGRNPENETNEMDNKKGSEVVSREPDEASEEQLSPKDNTSKAEAYRNSMKETRSPEEIQKFNEENGYGQLEERKNGGVERQQGEEDPRREAYSYESDGEESDTEQ